MLKKNIFKWLVIKFPVHGLGENSPRKENAGRIPSYRRGPLSVCKNMLLLVLPSHRKKRVVESRRLFRGWLCSAWSKRGRCEWEAVLLREIPGADGDFSGNSKTWGWPTSSPQKVIKALSKFKHFLEILLLLKVLVLYWMLLILKSWMSFYLGN